MTMPGDHKLIAALEDAEQRALNLARLCDEYAERYRDSRYRSEAARHRKRAGQHAAHVRDLRQRTYTDPETGAVEMVMYEVPEPA